MALSNGKTWRQAFLLGAQWGCGHSIGIVAAVLVAVFVTDQLVAPNSTFSTMCKYITGFCLVVLGIWTLYSAKKEYDQALVLTQMSSSPKLLYGPPQCRQDASYVLLQSADDPTAKPQLTASATSVVAGIIHGVAGPGCLLAVLPTLAMHKDTFRAMLYLGCFCVSSVLAMGSFAALYGELTQRGGRAQSPSAAYYVGLVSSALSISVGIVWIVW